MHDAALLSSAVQSGIADQLVLAPAIVRRDRKEARAHHPTLPSRLTEISFCPSTANSMGSCCSTSLTNPLTTSATASSAESPRCMQKTSVSSEIFEVVASCSKIAEEFFASI